MSRTVLECRFTRDGSDLRKRVAFYSCFYACLAAFTYGMLELHSLTLDDRVPKSVDIVGSGGGGPGLAFRPANEYGGQASTVVYAYSGGSPHGHGSPFTARRAAEELDLITSRREPTTGLFDCPMTEVNKPVFKPPGMACRSADLLQEGGPCSAELEFGYTTGQPCVLVKLNRIYGWVPEPYQNVTEARLDDMPNHMRKYFNDLSPDLMGNLIWLTCDGETALDRELLGPVQYHPYAGFPTYHFPYENGDAERAVLGAAAFVQFADPARGVLIRVRCRAWARNIRGEDASLAARFALLVD